jgi:hypothetical protein
LENKQDYDLKESSEKRKLPDPHNEALPEFMSDPTKNSTARSFGNGLLSILILLGPIIFMWFSCFGI